MNQNSSLSKMPASQNHSERRKKFIEQLKNKGKFDDYKKRRAELEKARRIRKIEAIGKLTASKRKLLDEEERARVRARVHKHRQAKKDGNDEAVGIIRNVIRQPPSRQSPSTITFDFAHSYKSTSAIRKAYTKTNLNLPSSPSKRKVIATKVVRSFNARDRADICGCAQTTGGGRQSRLRESIIRDIENFYERDDISRISPNVKDAKPFRNPCTGEKELRQLRYLIFSLSEVFSKFVEEYERENNSEPPVKLAKFCKLRPDHVLLLGETPRNVCYCIYHSNFNQCCDAINNYVPQLPKDYREMVKLLVCASATQNCYFKKCKSCSMSVTNQKLKSMVQPHTKQMKSVTWLQWLKDKELNRFQNELRNGTIQQLVDYFISIYAAFLKHSFIMHEQAEYFNIDQKRVDAENHFDEATLNIDFPENFKCESQDEIQPANYNQKQISLFISVLRHAQKLHTKAIISDNTNHTKDTIVAYLYKIFISFPSTVKVVKIWSDGPSNQFKNKFIAAAILFLEQKFDVKIFWNFFATAHGKASVDGIGATVKKRVRSMILSKQRIIYTANDFVIAFKSKESKIDCFGLTGVEIEEINESLNLKKIFSEARPVPGISECHQLQVVNSSVKGFVTSREGYQY